MHGLEAPSFPLALSERRFTMSFMDLTLTAVFEEVPQAEGGGYVPYTLELPGAITQGDTLDEAQENLRDAVKTLREANRCLVIQREMQMRRATKKVTNRKKAKAALSERSKTLLDRIRSRREAIRERAGLLSDSSAFIREERDGRF